MTSNRTQLIARLSILTALTVVLGYYTKLPTPTGIVTLLDLGVYFTAFYFGRKEGAIVGGVGAFLLDLISGYPQWMFFSLLFHGGQGYFAGFKGKARYLGLLLCDSRDGRRLRTSFCPLFLGKWLGCCYLGHSE